MKTLRFCLISMFIIYFIFASVNGLNPMNWEGDWKSAYVCTQIIAIVCVSMGFLIAEDSKTKN